MSGAPIALVMRIAEATGTADFREIARLPWPVLLGWKAWFGAQELTAARQRA